jgi:hypothetical protein
VPTASTEKDTVADHGTLPLRWLVAPGLTGVNRSFGGFVVDAAATRADAAASIVASLVSIELTFLVESLAFRSSNNCCIFSGEKVAYSSGRVIIADTSRESEAIPA